MAAAAHTPGGFGGVPQSVGKDFNQADKGGKLLSRAMKGKRSKLRVAGYAGGRFRGKISQRAHEKYESKMHEPSEHLATTQSVYDRERRGEGGKAPLRSRKLASSKSDYDRTRRAE